MQDVSRTYTILRGPDHGGSSSDHDVKGATLVHRLEADEVLRTGMRSWTT